MTMTFNYLRMSALFFAGQLLRIPPEARRKKGCHSESDRQGAKAILSCGLRAGSKRFWLRQRRVALPRAPARTSGAATTTVRMYGFAAKEPRRWAYKLERRLFWHDFSKQISVSFTNTEIVRIAPVAIAC